MPPPNRQIIKNELEQGGDTLDHKRDYLFWLN
jgi:hypothetical protein